MGKRLNKRNRRRRSSSRSFRSGNAGPILKLLGVVFGALAGLALLVFGVMFVLEAFFKVDTPLDASGIIGKFAGKINTPLIETPSPVPTVEPTPTPHPMEGFDPAAAQRELILPGELNYPWLADPSSYAGTVILSAGRLADGKVKLERLVSYDIAAGSASELDVKPENDHLLHPVFNDKWLVYFDANYDFGGGAHVAAPRRLGRDLNDERVSLNVRAGREIPRGVVLYRVEFRRIGRRERKERKKGCQCCQDPIPVSSSHLDIGNWQLAPFAHWQHSPHGATSGSRAFRCQ